MAAKKINRKDWQNYFDTFSQRYLKGQQSEYIEIQLLSEKMGVQPGSHWTILKGIMYDPKRDILEIQVDRRDHMISHPEQIYVEEIENGWLMKMQVTQRGGERNIIDIR